MLCREAHWSGLKVPLGDMVVELPGTTEVEALGATGEHGSQCDVLGANAEGVHVGEEGKLFGVVPGTGGSGDDGVPRTAIPARHCIE